MATLNIDNKLFDRLLLEAGNSPRKRAHHNIHKNYSEPVQRLCIALKSGTYIRPHCHFDVDAWEMIMVLKGDVVMLIFDADGYVKKRYELSSNTGNVGVELTPNTWHTLFPADAEAVIFEVKEGPFTPKKESDFACWAPEENSSRVDEFLSWAQCAVVGDQYQK